ncbi:MAG: anaerobic glycerol-3-phosphate dehydrogenase subunit C [Planctomycetales bacterium]|nr:anaerobic glycerol-3-phosphate dehydrogenase subunit C [Planctomycetales bacterium]
MDAEQRRIEEDLRGQLDGRVRCDDLFTQLYATDASIYELRPLGVVRPRHAQDVSATVRYAAQNGIPVHARGAGTGLAGESLGRGLIVDFSCYMRRIGEIGEDHVTVQAGVVLDRLSGALAKRGRVFGPDPATRQVSTVGGAIAVDSSGSRWPAYGSLRDQVLELEVVLADGATVRLHRNHNPDATAADLPAATLRTAELAAGVAAICREHADALAHSSVASCVDRSGYWLPRAVRDDGVDLARLAAGSEGTLALVTEAKLTTHARPPFLGSVLLFFNSMERAAEAAAELGERRVRACDLMDRRHLTLARESDPRYEFLIPAATEAVLLVEQAAHTADELRYALLSVVDLAVKQRKLAVDAHLAADEYEDQLLWQLARRYTPTLYRLRGSTRPIPFVEDIAVPPARLAEFLRAAQDTLNQFQVTASIFGHASHGQLHIRPLMDLAAPEEVAQIDALALALYEQAWRVGGTISGEHGEGLSRTPFAERQHGPRMAAFRAVKELFDPAGLLNPGKKIPASTECVITRLRRVTLPREKLAAAAEESGADGGAASPRVFDLQLDWTADEMAHAVRACNGCGACRTQNEAERMCPIFRHAPREEASPRAKANLVRGILTGSLPPETLLEEAAKEVADLCVHCHMCRLECPANVDIPRLMVEAKAQYVATNGLPVGENVLARLDDLCRWASRAPRLANWMLRDRVARWVLEKLLGIAQGRKLPRFTRRPFMRRAIQSRLHESRAVAEQLVADKVAVFVDTFANYCDPQLAEALVAVLRHNGVKVLVPQYQQQAGMPLIAHGLVEPARRIAKKNAALFAEHVRQGYTIVSTEPSAILALTHEYLQLLPGDEDAQLVADNSLEACQYLWRLHQRGGLKLNFQPLDLAVGYHKPCHMIALDPGDPTVHLLNLIPELRVHRIDKGCSGIAGLYGFKKANYRNSLRVGLPLMSAMRTGRFHAGTTECSTCRVQMEQGAAKPTVHPVKLLALAYDLMPEIRNLLHRPAEDLVVR